MFSRFFVDRPIFSTVFALIIMLSGILAINVLPVSQHPTIAPPEVTITATYPGASAETLTRTVTQVIEQEMTSLDGLMYMDSQSDSTGNVTITLTFIAGTDPDIAQVQVQNKLSNAETRLPEMVTRLGVIVSKSSASFLQVIGFVDTTGRMSSADLGDFLVNNIVEPLGRVDGVGQTQAFAGSYAMRIWMEPSKMVKYGLQPSDVVAAVSEQNVQVAAGAIGDQPSSGRQMITANIQGAAMLSTAEEFNNIAVRTESDGSVVRISDIGWAELGQQTYNYNSWYDGKPTTGVAVKLSNGANALDVAARIQAMLDEMSPYFPEGVEVVVPFDTTPFVRAAMKEVVKTLIEAILLVIVIMYLFLQNWRATIIPTVAVPIVLMGTFAILALLGYSINMLTMFALVLAIGLLVDDAIVVVENVERVMREDGSDAKTATLKSMGEITGALIGIAMVLSAVFIPMAFFKGSTGVIYRQFSVTIVSAMVLSVMVAITVTPCMCAALMKQDHRAGSRKGFFGWFNRGFNGLTNGVRSSVRVMAKRYVRVFILYLGLCFVVGWGYMRMPTAFMPTEDQGSLMLQMQTAESATAERTDNVIERVIKMIMETEKEDTDALMVVRGFSFGGMGQNNAMGFLHLTHWDERKSAEKSMGAIIGRLVRQFASPEFMDVNAFVFPLPAVPELGVAEGFDFYIQDHGAQGHDALMEVMNNFLAACRADPRLTQVRHNGMEDTPMLKLIVDYDKARTLGVSNSTIDDALGTAYGSTYVNDFIDQGRVKRVYVQGASVGRNEEADLDKWHVRSSAGTMVPFSAFTKTQWIYGPPRIERFNAIQAVEIMGEPASGVSTGEAMQAIREHAETLPPGYGIAWTGISYQEAIAGSNAAPMYAISLLVVFLCLAALYESWSIPLSVILVVPCGVLGALGLTWLTGRNNDVYFQVGLLTTVGLMAKNAILIVEFAKDLSEHGMAVLEAVVEAVRLRLRPILMTSLAFGFGVLPLAMAHGAGSGAQSAIGIAVLGGMLTGTFLGIFLVPAFYVMINRLSGRRSRGDSEIVLEEQVAAKSES